MADWSRIVNTTTKNFIKGEEVNILRNRKLTALLKSKGRISMNWSGDGTDWKIRYKRAPLQGYADTETLSFPRRDRWKTATLPYRGAALTDQITKSERLKNKSVQAIVNVYEQITKSLLDDAMETLGDWMYLDGNLAANAKSLFGLESFLSVSGPSSDAPIGLPNDNFAGLSTALAGYGGVWSGSNWPAGHGDSHFDFNSPLVVNYTSTVATADGGWTASTKTWANTCVEALRYAILYLQKNKSKKGGLDLILMDRDLYRQFLQQLDSKERIVIDRGKAAGGLQTLGFSDVTSFDGIELTTEFGCPSGVAYALNFDECEFRSQQSQLFDVEGPEWDIAGLAWRYAITMFGQMVWNARNFGKLMSVPELS